eukprot:CFRG2311T1
MTSTYGVKREAGLEDKIGTNKKVKVESVLPLEHVESLGSRSRRNSVLDGKTTLSYMEESSDDDAPLLPEKKFKREIDKKESVAKKVVVKKKPVVHSDSDDEPLSNIVKKKKPIVKKERKGTSAKGAIKPKAKASTKGTAAKGGVKGKVKAENADGETNAEKRKRLAREEEQKHIWKWWEEELEYDDGQVWKTLDHSCPVLAPEYVPLPKNVKLIYDGKPVSLCLSSEEAAGFYAAMIKTDYASKDVFIKNFFSDWRQKYMNAEEKKLITDWKKIDFSNMVKHFEKKSEERKAMTKDQKLLIKQEKESVIEERGWALVDGHRERVGNFMVEPPGLFRGRGDHPKMGRIKARILPGDITINIGKGVAPPVAPPGHTWKEVVNNDKVTWLASWTENICDNIKYVMLNAHSRMKGVNDFKKYEKARGLKGCIEKIRKTYTEDLKNKEMSTRQRGTALYFIDRLALRVGNEKDTSEEADTVGCCSIRLEHVTLEGDCKITLDFLGKDSIRYINTVEVEPQVYKNIKIFMQNKTSDIKMFDRLQVPQVNSYLQTMMEGLTAKVFRTYNASITLQQELAKTDIKANATDVEKLAAYNAANRAVAILCNHQRAIPKAHDESVGKMQEQVKGWKKDLKELKKELKGTEKKTTAHERLSKKIKTLDLRISKKEVQIGDKEDNKTVALGTSKINYMDPRISVAWCKKVNLPVDKVFNKTLRQKFLWALHAEADFFW